MFGQVDEKILNDHFLVTQKQNKKNTNTMKRIIVVLLFGLVCIAAAQRLREDPPYPLNLVDPRIGTGSNLWGVGHNNPAAQYPFGPFRLGPDTALNSLWLPMQHFSGYHWSDSHVRAFSHTHVCGAGLPEFGNFGVMVIRQAAPTTDTITEWGYRSTFSHDSEQMYPGFYTVYLDSHRARVELTAAGTHAGAHRYSFDESGPMTLLLDICHSISYINVCNYANVNVTVSQGQNGIVEISATMRNDGELTSREGLGRGLGVLIHFYAQIVSSTPLRSHGLWANRTPLPGATSRSDETSQSLGVYLDFGDYVSGGRNTIEVFAGISFVSSSNARLNMETQIQRRSFDQILSEATRVWADLLLSTVQVETARRSDAVKLYTNVMRTFMSPTQYSEVDGSYPGMDLAIHYIDRGHLYYSDHSLWDTYRTQNPWLVLVKPDVALDIARSFVLMGEQGGELPIWPIVNKYTACMYGDNYDQVLLDTYVKGLKDFNISSAYIYMRSSAMVPQKRDGRLYIESYLKYGYVALEDAARGTSETLGYAYNDWTMAQWASILGKEEDRKMFAERANWYKNVFDPEQLFMVPRYANGTFKTLRLPIAPYHPNYVEGNAWHYTWDVPHDINGFIDLWPSVEAFVEKLDYSHRKAAETINLFNKNWLPNPYLWIGNEHDLIFPFEFHQAGRTDLTQYWVRWLLEYRWTDQPDGLPGMDDYATMSAWYAFASIGFYPLTGADWYWLVSPVYDKVSVRVTNGNTLTVIAINNSPENVYVERVLMNDRELTSPYVTHAELTSGATFTFYMSSSPNTFFNLNNDEARRRQAQKKA